MGRHHEANISEVEETPFTSSLKSSISLLVERGGDGRSNASPLIYIKTTYPFSIPRCFLHRHVCTVQNVTKKYELRPFM
jgi:hypothetical protein